jgi:hypothetical protein
VAVNPNASGRKREGKVGVTVICDVDEVGVPELRADVLWKKKMTIQKAVGVESSAAEFG